MFDAKFDYKLLIRDCFIMCLAVVILGFVLERYFRGIMITVVSLNFWVVLTTGLGVAYVVLSNQKK